MKEIEKILDSEKVFNQALSLNLFTNFKEDKERYIGYYMYMYSVKNKHYFKNIKSRKYLELTFNF